MFMSMIAVLLIFLHQPIPDFVMIILAGGMLMCIISSVLMGKEKEERKLPYRR